jgi:murein DD-endopeptidase MepM/ murein hydrolase activator NlpD
LVDVGHVSEVLVDVGQSVKVGEPIARVGDSGVATGAHLHLEVRFGGNTYNHTRNPDLWISPDIWYGVIIGRVMDAQGYFVPAQLVTLHDAQDSRRYRRETYSYPNDVVNSDDMYLENFSFADVPTGDYILNATFDGHTLTVPVSVREQQASFVVIQSPITSTVSASTAR